MTSVSAGRSRPPATRATLAAHLVRDRFVQLQVLTSAAVAALYLLPLIDQASLQRFAYGWLCVPFTVWPLVGCLVGVRWLPAGERVAWRLVAAGLAAWLAALVTYGAMPSVRGHGSHAVVAALYLGFYISVLLAVERKPHQRGGLVESPLEQWLRALGIVTFVGGWTIYSILVPDLVDGKLTESPVLDSITFVLLDVVIIARLGMVMRQADTRRWRWIYGALALASTVLLATDSLNVLLSRDVIVWPDGEPTDLLWGLPALAFVAAVRVRHHAFSEPADPVAERSPVEPRPAGLGIFLMLGGLSFPLLHMALQAAGVVPGAFRSFADIALIVVVANAVLLSALAVAAYSLLERQRTRMQQERRALEARLLQAQRMEAVGRLAGGVAHDFNNLLTVIAGYNDMALEAMPAGDQARELLEEVRQASHRAASLTGQLLSFSRRRIVKAAPVDLNAMIVDLERMLRGLIGEDVVLEVRLDPGAPHVLADRGQLEQVVLNLALNARDAMPSGGTISVATSCVVAGDASPIVGADLPDGRYACLAVGDTGPGVPDDALPHLFEPFFTTRERERGTGLDLAMVYGVVTQGGGAITVDAAPARGTVFRVYLPATAAPARATRPAATVPDASGAGETILLVEDEVAVRSLARRSLERRGFRVVEAMSATHAVEIATTTTGPLDLLLTDVVMPELNGREVAERVSAARPGIPVLFMSGYADDSSVYRGVLADRLQLLQKPFTPDALATRVRAELDAAALATPPGHAPPTTP